MTGQNMSLVNAKTAFDAAKLDDKTAKKVVEDFIMYLGEGITNIINAFQPEVIVLGGGISNEGEYLLSPLREFIDEHRYTKKETPSAIIKKAELGNDAGIIGAAFLKS
jgi:glucokinase